MSTTALGHTPGLWAMVWGAGPMVKFVLLVLFVFSVVSWAIIVYKMMLMKKIERETSAFYDMFWAKRQFSEIHAISRGFQHTPLKNIFSAAYKEVERLTEGSGGAVRPLQRESLVRLERILAKTHAVEAARLEYAVGFLATTGNTAPFIGLFGTVWGIMSSFQSIGAKGAASLAVVAPGISEALVATAMGLAAAIPAVIGYNHLNTRIARLDAEMANFNTDMLNILEREING